MLAALVLALAACGSTNTDTGSIGRTLANTPLQDCCTGAESFPPALVGLVDPIAPVFGVVVGNMVLRPGYVLQTGAQQKLLREVQPLDVLVLSSKGHMSGNLIPGLFGHVITYLGTEAELRKLRVWDDPRVVPHHDSIRAGAVFIESDLHGVHLSTPDQALDTDRIAVLRPNLAGTQRRRQALVGFYARIGTKFDFRMDNATTAKLYCGELVAQVMPELSLPVRPMYGRQSIMPDDVVAEAAVQRSRLDLVYYLRANRNGAASGSRATLIRDISGYWANQNRNSRPI
ncbi:YiiX/YebB-like N1pC/P60 family cysteine hydrolase [Rhodobacter ferrooxidans]|uniref:YiiX/YebB-like N1pC/P60 family cysteine hydrolase n=1 Tax=Rhodobacter ferrooxidans TaxID=371731 RepID=UPI0003026F15|nr:YiiX/YebB-like N1pC/P60 family cysteine hydrolase [Rhodobacter sp. SW2]